MARTRTGWSIRRLQTWIAACTDLRIMRQPTACLVTVAACLGLLLAACGSGTPRPGTVASAPPAAVPTSGETGTSPPTANGKPTTTSTSGAQAQQSGPPGPARPPASLVRPVLVPTEGVSLWTDEYLFAGWAIQGQFYSGQHRLIDRNIDARNPRTAQQVRGLDRLRDLDGVRARAAEVLELLDEGRL